MKYKDVTISIAGTDHKWTIPAPSIAALQALVKSRKFREWKEPRRRKRALLTPPEAQGGPSKERHYTVSEVAVMWNCSRDLVRDIFRDEPTVLKFDRPATRTKRGYSTLRIPESALGPCSRGNEECLTSGADMKQIASSTPATIQSAAARLGWTGVQMANASARA